MTPQQWQRVRPILECALELEPESRPAYVDSACAGDDELRVEILSLLSEPKQSDSFLIEPALNMVRRHMAQDQAQLDNAEEFNLVGKNPPPTRVRLPENTLLNPNGVLNMQDLVPGVHMPLRASLFSIDLIQMQKLNTVHVTETGEDGEKITISLGPAPKLLIG